MPRPMSPAWGTQNISVVIGAPTTWSGSAGPGTLVITPDAFSENILTTWRWTQSGARPIDCRIP